MSCNGCRVLRKGCSDDCAIRPCLQWISSPDSQANATMFLAKFYGRAGLVNLISAGSEHVRPAIFRSLLYEACGRIINPIYGSVGLFWSGNWSQCHSAVNSVLKGSTHFMRHVTLINSAQPFPALKTYDIRHNHRATSPATSYDIHKVRTSRPRFKQSILRPTESKPASSQWLYDPTSCDSIQASRLGPKRDSLEGIDSLLFAETVEAFLVSRSGPDRVLRFDGPKSSTENHVVKLDLTLGIGAHADACMAELADHH
ncbi:LOB domain-containing protein 42-like [Punica granatum]|uniref:LOB domain-containing protein n=2 Tax=Punica granatum TaxID=22663 RepID=A0A218WUX3_PUNGR|nr:LOB domain-containing protein 42-like [Punica granatum]OWM75772.1 hypothetical protein CDL15_Pgr009416 [Punica granatum]PKI60461.1 hypothetical protein CRG98_019115 [Punica granatum]